MLRTVILPLTRKIRKCSKASFDQMPSPQFDSMIPFAVEPLKGEATITFPFPIQCSQIVDVSIGQIPWRITASSNSAQNIPVRIDCNETTDYADWFIDAGIYLKFTCEANEKFVEKTLKIGCNALKRSEMFTLTKEEVENLFAKEEVEVTRIGEDNNDATDEPAPNPAPQQNPAPTNPNPIPNQPAGIIKLKVKIEILRKNGLRHKTVFTYDFLKQNDLSSLVVLIEDKKVFVNVDYLAQFSEYFYSRKRDMDNLDKDKESELPLLRLDNISCDDFIQLLTMVYPTETKVTGDNVEHILKIADYLLFETVLMKCEQFLTGNDPTAVNISVYKKLQWAFTYRMSALRSMCLKQLTSYNTIAKLRNEPIYAELGDEVKVALYDRIMELVQQQKA